MSAKSLLRYKTTVGGNALINSPHELLQKSPDSGLNIPTWQPPAEIKQISVKMSSSEKVTSGETGGNRKRNTTMRVWGDQTIANAWHHSHKGHSLAN